LVGVEIDALTEADTLDRVATALSAGEGGRIVTPNLDQLRVSHPRADLRRIYADAQLVVADGMPLIWAARLQGTPLPERVAGSDLVWSLAELAAATGSPLFLLGGNPGAAEAAADNLRERHPDLRIAGTHCPPFGFEADPTEVPRIRSMIDSSGAKIVFVGLGYPKQEILITDLLADLPQVWFLGCGVSLSFIAGDVARAPGWMQRSGLEWLYRLIQEPRRLLRRYLWDDPPFAMRLFASSIVGRLRARRGATSR
jgi:N-acetylglucosaminyldiphosphoundecaprenol N-acetyl-beta-D-mannosaminyltransferase